MCGQGEAAHQRPLHNGQPAAPVNYAQAAEAMGGQRKQLLPASEGGGGGDPAG